MHTENIGEKFEHLLRVISAPKFLRMEALGGEIPFFISAYNPAQENEVGKAVGGLAKNLEKKGISVETIDLYKLTMEILDQELGPGEIFEIEKGMEKDEFRDALQSILDIHQVLMPAIKSVLEQSAANVYFLTGIGQVYPFIRSHNILNNLQSIARKAPTVVFFPGRYNGESLELFGLLKDDNYYRAFNLDSDKT